MRILIAFNNYADIPTGGERNVVLAEEKLLREHGHEVLIWERSNRELQQMSPFGKFKALWQVTYSPELKAEAGRIIESFKPDIFHLHNYWLRMTPSVFEAACQRKIPVVHTLHNFRMICPGTQLMHRGKPCEDCLKDGRFIRCLLRHCFLGGGRLKTFLSWRLYREIRRRGFFKREVNAFIALTEFSRQKFIQGGLPADKIYVKPNFLSDPLKEYPHLVRREAGGYGAVFIGRLSSEKGVTELVRAWKGCDYPLEVIGQGALESTLRQMKIPRVSFTGGLSHEEALRRLSGSAFLIFPSVWYETFGLTMIEAMALGKPVLASRLGGREYIVPEGKAGILYDPFKSGELESGIRKMIHLSTAEKEKMGDYGRKYYLENFTPEVNYQKLMEIYERAAADAGV